MNPNWATDERLPGLLQAIDRLMSSEMVPSGVSHLWASTPPMALPLVLAFVAIGVWHVLDGPARSKERKAKEAERRANNNGWLTRLRWKMSPPVDLMKIDGLVIDRSREPHCAWLAPTGGGKSVAVASIRVDGKRPTLIVTPDLSDPLHEATLRLGGVVWTACESTVPINFLIGTAQEVAERLTEVFRSGGVGTWKREARLATAGVIERMDDAGIERTLKNIGMALRAWITMPAGHPDAPTREQRQACSGWVSRFLDMADQFGSSIGPDGYDIADLLNQGKTVCLEISSFDHPALCEDVVALGLAEAKRVAALVPGGFRLIFEEAGQLQERIELAYPFFRAGRRRKITVDVLTQAESDLKFKGNDAITSNIATHVYFSQKEESLQKAAANRLGLPHTDLAPGAMEAFTAYVVHDRIRRLVRFPKPPKARNWPVPQSPQLVPTEGSATYVRQPEWRKPVEMDGWYRPYGALPGYVPPAVEVIEVPAWVRNDPLRQEIFNELVREDTDSLLFRPEDGFWKGGPCLTWHGADRGNGRPGKKIGAKTHTVYRLTCEWGGKEILPSYQVDHLCANTMCCEPDHLEPVTSQENMRRKMLRARAMKAMSPDQLRAIFA